MLNKTRMAMAVIVTTLIAGTAHAQQADIPRVEIGILPAGATVFTEGDNGEPSFATYAVAGSVTVNANRFIGIEGEIGGNLGIEQDLDFPAGTVSAQPPHMLSYTGNVVIHPVGRDRGVAPYVTGGIGGLTLFERTEVGVADNTTFFAGTVGGGLKVDLTDGLGLRVDYRFIPVASQDDAPAFFGRGTRYGHRIAGGVTINLAR
ncbi:MAG: outer membrane protein [Vicinamibacterales bacterium]